MDATSQKIITALRQKRLELAMRKGVEVFKIFQNKTIEEIAAKKPKTLEELAKIKGIGRSKLLEFGKMILEIVHSATGQVMAKAVEDEKKPITVSEFLSRLNRILTSQESLVRGEINQIKFTERAVYFSLKDKKDESVINCYLSQWKYESLGVSVDEGMEVVVNGSPEIYKPTGRLSLTVNSIELIGEGALKKAYEILKKKLEAEGFFSRKRPIPQFIKKIGVVSSKDGVVIHDFNKNLARRGFKIYFYDSRMEGQKAVAGVINAIKFLSSQPIDVIVIIRGGGSFESLQAFNNENVARAIFGSKIPLICGIGHEVDVPISCLVSDLAPSTPTAVAIAINSTWSELENKLPLLSEKLFNFFETALAERYLVLKSFIDKVSAYVGDFYRRTNIAAVNLVEKFAGIVESKRELIKIAEKLLAAMNPENTLRLGYSIVFDAHGRVLKNAALTKPGDIIKAKLQKGAIGATINEIKT